ncbi:MAG: PPOX class F420-dependent oxidoreductase [Actinobacteria bacterium]|nr:PPOX class F420-dependent oxidoreductase [Actinomycetota bacterium]
MPTIPKSHKDLLEADFATFATIDSDGRPQLSEVWFIADGNDVKVSLNTSRHKTKHLQRRPACNVFILDVKNPYRYLEIRGDARLAPDDDYEFAARVGKKYDADLRQHDQPGDSRVVVTIEPTRINAVDMSA